MLKIYKNHQAPIRHSTSRSAQSGFYQKLTHSTFTSKDSSAMRTLSRCPGTLTALISHKSAQSSTSFRSLKHKSSRLDSARVKAGSTSTVDKPDDKSSSRPPERRPNSRVKSIRIGKMPRKDRHDIRSSRAKLHPNQSSGMIMDALAGKIAENFGEQDPSALIGPLGSAVQNATNTKALEALLIGQVTNEVALTQLLGSLGRRRMPECLLSVVEWAKSESSGITFNLFHYTKLIACLGRCGRWDETMHYFQELKHSSSLSPNQAVYREVLIGCQRCAHWKEAVVLLEEMQGSGLVPSAAHFNPTLGACARAGEWTTADAVLSEMQSLGIRRDLETYHSLLTTILPETKGAAEMATRYYSDMITSGVSPDTEIVTAMARIYNVSQEFHRIPAVIRQAHAARANLKMKAYRQCMNILTRATRWADVLEVFHHLDQSRTAKPDTRAYNIVISACGKAGRWETAVELHSAMVTSGLKRDAVTFNSLISAYGQGGQWLEASHAVVEMRACGLAPNTITFNALIHACMRGGQWREALRAYQEMLAEGVKPSIITFTSLISACEKGGDWEQALALFHEAVRLGLTPNTVTYSVLISALASAQPPQWEKALEVFEWMPAAGVQPNTFTFNSLISALGAGEQCTRAIQVFESMGSAGCSRDVVTYNTLISAHEKAGSWEDALLLLQRMQEEDVSPTTVTFNTLISACGKAGCWDQAMKLYSKMKLKTSTAPDIITYNALISACGRGNQWREAIRVYTLLKFEGLQADRITFTALIGACGRSGKWEQALQYFEHMKEGGLDPDPVTYRVLIDACVRGYQLDVAKEVFEEMRNLGTKVSKATSFEDYLANLSPDTYFTSLGGGDNVPETN